MKTSKSPARKFAICVNNREYPVSLELHKLYTVLPDAEAERDGFLRIIDESSEDYLFPAEYFLRVDFPPTIKRALQSSFARRRQPA